MATTELKQTLLDEEYKKTGISPEDIADLRRWLETQPHLPSKHITDLDLILAYYSCDCSSGVTKDVIDLHYTLRTLFTNYFKDRFLDAMVLKSLETVLLTHLPSRTKDGYAIFYMHLIDYDPKNFNVENLIKCIFIISDLWQYSKGAMPGLVIIVDFEGMPLGHTAKFDLQNVQHFLYFLQEAMFTKVKGIHFLNAPSFINKLVMIIKSFMKKELMDMFVVHPPGSTAIQSVLPLEALPKESGGKYKSYAECRDDVVAMVRAGESYLRNENLKRVTESLRPGKPKTITDVFGGVVGSFKKLDID